MTDGNRTTADPEPGSESIEWLSLAADETVDWRGGPRIQTVYPWVGLSIVGTVAVLAAVALEVVSLLALLWLPVFVAPALWQYARVTRTVFLVTTHRVAVRSGVFGVTVRTAGLDRIQNTSVVQEPIGRLVGYGTVTIDPAGGPEFEFWNVDDPASVLSELESRREHASSSGVPGSADRWEAVLEEVRGWRRAVERER